MLLGHSSMEVLESFSVSDCPDTYKLAYSLHNDHRQNRHAIRCLIGPASSEEREAQTLALLRRIFNWHAIRDDDFRRSAKRVHHLRPEIAAALPASACLSRAVSQNDGIQLQFSPEEVKGPRRVAKWR